MNVPTTASNASLVAETPQELFEQGRITGLSAANVRAIRDGADIGQIVNAYRRTAGMQFAQVPAIKRIGGRKFTLEGTTNRGRAGQQQLGLRRHGAPQARLMPESIYATASSHEEATRLLKLYGWIGDDAGLARGRAIIAEQRRIARNARRRARRAEQRAR